MVGCKSCIYRIYDSDYRGCDKEGVGECSHLNRESYKEE